MSASTMILIVPATFVLLASFIKSTHRSSVISSIQRHPWGMHLRSSKTNHIPNDEQEQLHSPAYVETELLKLAQSHFVAQVLLAFVRLRLPDVMDASHGMTVDEMMDTLKHTPIRRDVLFRCLRLLCTAGIIKEAIKEVDGISQSAFVLTEVGSSLQTSNPQSMVPFIQHWMEAPLWNAWSQLPDYIAGNGADQHPFDIANGVPASEYYDTNTDSQKHRNAVARYASSREITSILDAITSSNTSPHMSEINLWNKAVVDIGGGYGDLLIELKRRIPAVAKCFCLDLPNVIEDAKSTSNGKKDTITLVAGDMFDHETIPCCDVIVTKHVLCDFSDEDVVRALKSFHKALSYSGKLIIMDAVLPNENDLNGKWNAAVSFDVLLMLSGRRGERSRLEWSNLAMKAGFILEDILPTSAVTVDLAIFRKSVLIDG